MGVFLFILRKIDVEKRIMEMKNDRRYIL